MNVKLEIKLTEDQSLQVRKFWAENGSDGRAMIVQPIMCDGNADILRFGMLSPEGTMAVQSVVVLERKRQ